MAPKRVVNTQPAGRAHGSGALLAPGIWSRVGKTTGALEGLLWAFNYFTLRTHVVEA